MAKFFGDLPCANIGGTVHIVHERIKQARCEKGLTQKDMADALGISQPGYQQLESGARHDMRISTLIKLCNILQVSADWVLGINER